MTPAAEFAAAIRGGNIRYVCFDFGGGIKGEYSFTGSNRQQATAEKRKKQDEQQKQNTHKK